MKTINLLWLITVCFLVSAVMPFDQGHCNALESFKNLNGTISIAGGTAHIPVMNDAAKTIMTFNPAVRITVEGGGTGVGVQKVGEGLVDIGNTGRALSPEEIGKYGLRSYAFALDGVAAVVNAQNSVSNLSAEQIMDIFAGKISNWKEVGGRDAAIHLFSRDEASGTREVFWKKLLKQGTVAQSANIVPSNGAMKVAVAQDPNAIGYVSIGHIDESVKALQLDGVAASQENALNGSYPVVRKLYMNTRGEPNPLVQAFIDYILSPDGAAIIRRHGYFPIE
ncbi:phosphate ABC transporter substrate-binding protein [Desulfoferrobacter suflitae]|uniref:phosphate ABC transporter substrate-binding protein n=1 Tax=Desulfoferrobacter suflitae TaxID=2865782 RepID=UPI00216446CA|nr:phosphate ABC transporter substrate-binding protein [Desulfoferrobacter suflitae]MCK8602585.1 phosphate ABC transporter substrate-binding protein [Desulfoferrobacter suflitae]